MIKEMETKFTAHYKAVDPVDREEIKIDLIKKRGFVTFTPTLNVCSLTFEDILELAKEVNKYKEEK